MRGSACESVCAAERNRNSLWFCERLEEHQAACACMCVCVLGGLRVSDAYVVVEGLLHLRPLVSACLLSLSFLRSLTGTFTHSRTRRSLFQAVPGGGERGTGR